MGLRINTNVAALNAQRNLARTDSMLAKSLERLSSGFRVNAAKDDAAGLSVAETFRVKVASLQKATQNATEANSLLQVAEGAANEIGNILLRLKELATQAASANTSSSDRSKLNSEASKLTSEIDRIANSTKYGSTALVNGTFGNLTTLTTIPASSGLVSTGVDISNTSVTSLTTYTLTDAVGTGITLQRNISGVYVTEQITASAATGAQTLNFSTLGVKITVDSGYTTSSGLDTAAFTVNTNTSGGTFQIGDENNTNNQLSVTLDNLTTSKIKNSAALSVDLSTQSGAQTAVADIDTSVSYITSARATIGAFQNRLGFASASLAVAIENFSASESVIRDADIAEETTKFTKAQILLQAGTAVLAQANAAPQSVLALLR